MRTRLTIFEPEAWAQCFTSDGVFQLGSQALRGHAALRAYGEIHAREMRYRHRTGNFLYDVTGEEALKSARRWKVGRPGPRVRRRWPNARGLSWNAPAAVPTRRLRTSSE
jgi:hypothetical protein